MTRHSIVQTDTDSRLHETLLRRAADREITAATSTLLGMVLVAYAHWGAPGRVLIPHFVLLRLFALGCSFLIKRRIHALAATGSSYTHLEWPFIATMGVSGAAWGLIGWMVPELNFNAWAPRDLVTVLGMVFISCMVIITLQHHMRALVAYLCAQWAVAIGVVFAAPAPLAQNLLIVVGILGLLAVLLMYGRMLNKETRSGVRAELRNDELTAHLQDANSKLAVALERAEAAANHDPLTGMLNRRALYARVEHVAASRRRHDSPCVVLLLDIDHFKHINDGHGHAAGDEVLQALAALLTTGVREVDVIARWGGEEFLLVMPDCTVDDALLRAEDVRVAVSGLKLSALPASHVLGVSIGAADWRLNEAFDAAVSRADAALYRAKEAGRNRVELSH